jgi:hypothetical protein
MPRLAWPRMNFLSYRRSGFPEPGPQSRGLLPPLGGIGMWQEPCNGEQCQAFQCAPPDCASSPRHANTLLPSLDSYPWQHPSVRYRNNVLIDNQRSVLAIRGERVTADQILRSFAVGCRFSANKLGAVTSDAQRQMIFGLTETTPLSRSEPTLEATWAVWKTTGI